MREADIRPDKLLERYLELCRQDAARYFPEHGRDDVPCPACGKDDPVRAFSKDGFAFSVCRACGTLYQTPRPGSDVFVRFYRDAQSSAYWAGTFFPAVAEARRTKLFAPKAARVSALCAESGFNPETVVEAGAGFGIFLDEWRKLHPQTRTVAVEPQPDMARRCEALGIETFQGFVEDAPLRGEADMVVAMEVIEHVREPLAFCQSLAELLRPGGRVLVTGLCIDGFDLRVLGERSRAICPPQHINFPSVAGYEKLFERAGFEDVAVFTPGVLDVDIVRSALRADPCILNGQPFLEELMRKDDATLGAFQRYLSDNRLSSHCWVWAARSGTRGGDAQ
ncbi:MAG: 3-demethylubiquinone-9 [Desulfovibrionaceae bacterium]|nr:MAG: 3-demethylubiquinone-9 [Desulfovibrionaceae bacterium]